MVNFRRLTLIVPMLLVLGGYVGTSTSFAETGTPGGGVLTRSVQNPVTKETLYRLENGLVVGVTALSSYKRLCEDKSIDQKCRSVVVTLQGYVHQARPLLRSLRTFVRKNDQVNAKVAFATIQNLLNEFRATAAANGIPVPNVGG